MGFVQRKMYHRKPYHIIEIMSQERPSRESGSPDRVTVCSLAVGISSQGGLAGRRKKACGSFVVLTLMFNLGLAHR